MRCCGVFKEVFENPTCFCELECATRMHAGIVVRSVRPIGSMLHEVTKADIPFKDFSEV
jgi:hypothetical protein